MTLQVQTQHNRGETNAHSTLFVRSGDVDLATGALRDFGINGYDWSRSAMASGAGTWGAKAYYLGFRASGVNPSGGPNNRYFGFPVRCLVILVAHLPVPHTANPVANNI